MTRCPSLSRLENNGGARWKFSFQSPSNCASIRLRNSPSEYRRATSYSSL
ncbi:Uncharacterised protein [Bordetella pertussis]|nr:Uncharacterised protein [Bordetella pertussis]CFW40468.1 Uncharacterised protein [Bordetella pertussis]